ncbi:hypothetical protein LTR66_007677 [Elasticomyces elasticus]|nr:hypothetical protein LTR66_007677 [Elasticomyces elasticus]
MKRKFSFGLPALKLGPSKAENNNLRDVLASQLYSPPQTPLPISSQRDPLSPKTEAELRSACAYVLQNFKPSSQVYYEQYGALSRQAAAQLDKPQLDYDTIKRSHRNSGVGPTTSSRSKRHSYATSPELAPLIDPAEPFDPLKYAYKPTTALKDLFDDQDATPLEMPANLKRRRDILSPELPNAPPATACATSAKSTPNPAKAHTRRKASVDRPWTAGRIDSTDTAGSTPYTDATDYPWSSSTAVTSAALTPARSSKRASTQIHHEQDNAARADAAAAEWMRQELEKRRALQGQQQKATAVPDPVREMSRPVSRARSITNEIRDYIRPGTSSSSRAVSPISRRVSKESVRSGMSDFTPSRTPSTHGWRSWGATLRRKTSSASLSDNAGPSSSRGRTETRGNEFSKSEVNLNRELPPLPGLDQWKDESTKATHVAALMGPKPTSQTLRRKEVPKERSKPPAKQSSSKPSKDATTDAQVRKPVAFAKSPKAANAKVSVLSAWKPKSDKALPVVPPATAVAIAVSKTRSADPPITSHRAPSTENASSGTRFTRQFSHYTIVADGGPDAQALAPTNTIDSKIQRHPSRPVDLPFPPELSHNMRSAPPTQASMDTYPGVAQGTQSYHTSRRPSANHPRPGDRALSSKSHPNLYQSSHGTSTATLPKTSSTTRKRSVDEHQQRSYDPRYPNVIDISPLPTSPPVRPKEGAKGKGIKGWFSGGRARKTTKQMTWMEQVESLGVKGGIMFEDEAAGAPVVRY